MAEGVSMHQGMYLIEYDFLLLVNIKHNMYFQLYAGYYQHEVKENLVDAEKMFEAMGYTLLPNRTLVLDGPICPDQVTNVSRDAMTAYVECQVNKLEYPLNFYNK